MFSKHKAGSSEGSGVPAHRSASGTFSVIGADVIITGDIAATADLHIDGNIDGDIRCAALVQGEASAIAGAVVADSARLAGSLTGSITARDLIIERTARVSGEISYERLTIEPGSTVEGRFTLLKGAEAAEADPPLKLVGAAE